METLALFVFGLLLLGDAHASTGSGSTPALVGDHFPAAACEPAALATQVAAPCVAVGMPTPTCCRPLVAVVDLGGGLRCLCRVAAEPEVVLVGLNATHLVGLYISCGGLHAGDLPAACKGAVAVVVARSERPAAALPGAIAAAAQVHSLATPDVDVARPEHQAAALPGSAVVATQNHSFVVAVARPEHHAPAFPDLEKYMTSLTRPVSDAGAIAAQDHSLAVARPEHQAAVYPAQGEDYPEDETCEADKLASQLVDSCVNGSSSDIKCCEAIVVVVDLPNCLCLVSLRPKIKESPFSAFTLITSYRACGGLRAVKQKDAALCYGFNETGEGDEQPSLPPPAGYGVGTATVKQPKVVDPVDNLSNFDRYVMAILEVATGVQIVYALFREIVNRLPIVLARNNIPRQV
uniref:Bifunctional inhibitor/plant lipid transfer protein/seed storage helical domain-containing protein n=1 Tax=Oryza punctata TaxID=4537 RepID=A0A0E0KHE8_ORYPU